MITGCGQMNDECDSVRKKDGRKGGDVSSFFFFFGRSGGISLGKKKGI